MRGVNCSTASLLNWSRQAHKFGRAVWPVVGYATCLSLTGLVLVTGLNRLVTVVMTSTDMTPARDMTPAAIRPAIGQAPTIRSATVQPPATRIIRSASFVPTNDEWSEKLRDTAFWAKHRAGGSKPANWTKPEPEPGQRAYLGFTDPTGRLLGFDPRRNRLAPRANDDDNGGSNSGGDTYRTVCVRTCDGAFFPLSFSTTRAHFDADAARCEKSCGGESRMFFHKNPGSDIGEMEDLQGRPYKKLPTAFLFKTKYVEACKCRPHPWEEASLTRHKVYALEQLQAKGNKTAAVELTDLRAKLKQTETEAAAVKLRAAAAKVAEQRQLAEAAKAAKANAKLAAKSDRSGAGSLPGNAPPPAGGPVPITASSVLSKQSPVAREWVPLAPKGQSTGSFGQSRVATDATVIYRVGATVRVLKPTAQSRISQVR